MPEAPKSQIQFPASKIVTKFSIEGDDKSGIRFVNDTDPDGFSYYGTDIFGVRGWRGAFKGSGVGHSAGLVPDPGPVAGSVNFLREDGAWSAVLGDVINANVGFRVAGAAPSGKILIGDGTNFVPSAFTWPNVLGAGSTILRSSGLGTVAFSAVSFPNAAGGRFQSIVSDGTNFGVADAPAKVSVTSTVDQTATTETAHLVFTVPANSAAIGTTYRITAWGNIDNNTTAITFTPRIRWGGTAGVQLIATPTIVGTTTAQTNKTWTIQALITIRTTGASGTAFSEMRVENHTASTTGLYACDESNSGATGVTIDTTASKDLDLTWTLSATTGAPHVRTIFGTIEIVKP